MVGKGKLAVFEGSISPKPEKVHPPKLVCRHLTSSYTYMIF